MTISKITPLKNDPPNRSSQDSNASSRLFRETIEDEGLLNQIPPPPKYEFLSPETVVLVNDWLNEQYETMDVVLECMANISGDFYKKGYYAPALETIREAWDCDRASSCSLKEMRHANLGLLRAKCHVGLMQYDEALEACAYSKEKGNKEAAFLETTIKKAQYWVNRLDCLSRPK